MSALKIIVAVAENSVIGADMDMPWKLSSDLKRFKQITLNQPIIMGRKTFESIGRPLPQRTNIVVTRNETWAFDGVEVASSLQNALNIASKSEGSDEGICIIGGGQIYDEAMQNADSLGIKELHVTHVEASPEGDTVFPAIDETIWQVVSSIDVEAGEKDNFATCYKVYQKRT